MLDQWEQKHWNNRTKGTHVPKMHCIFTIMTLRGDDSLRICSAHLNPNVEIVEIHTNDSWSSLMTDSCSWGGSLCDLWECRKLAVLLKLWFITGALRSIPQVLFHSFIFTQFANLALTNPGFIYVFICWSMFETIRILPALSSLIVKFLLFRRHYSEERISSAFNSMSCCLRKSVRCSWKLWWDEDDMFQIFFFFWHVLDP